MNKTARGFLTILCASFVWGVGNAVTGLTAQKYLSSGSLLPAIDISLANTIGGLCFLGVALLIRNVVSRAPGGSDTDNVSDGLRFTDRNTQTILSGALKGANTCLFVFSTTYIVATQALIFESTYIVWSLLLCIVFATYRVPLLSAIVKAGLLSIGVILVAGHMSANSSSQKNLLGPVFGICAGLSYAFFLFFWSGVTKRLVSLQSQLTSTILLLSVAAVTIVVMAEAICTALLRRWWIPFTYLRHPDIVLQFVNGVFVIGLVYLLVTVGMTDLKNVREGAGFVAALALSFSIPFTLLPEFVIRKFVPTELQFLGVFLFMVAFVLISSSLSEAETKR